MRLPARAFVLTVAAVAVALVASPALAADPDGVAAGIRDDGVFVEAGSDLSEEYAGELVATVRNTGEKFSIVVLTEEPVGGAATFGDAVVDRLDDPGLIFVLTPGDVAVVGIAEVYTQSEIDGALDFAIEEGGSDTDYATNFVVALTGEAVEGSGSEAASGGGSGLLWLVLLAGGIGLFLWWMVRRSKRQQQLATENELATARAEIQDQVDAVANDLLDMEDEVRAANSEEVDALYNAAGDTYRGVSDRLQDARTPAEFLDIANDLDLAIWQLDSAEAMLDGKEPPPRPEPKRLPEPEPAPVADRSGGSTPQSSPGPLGVPPRPTYPGGGYARRSTRRSRGMSPDLVNILVGMGAGAMARRGRSQSRASRSGTSTGSSRRSSGSSRRSSGTRTGRRIRTGRKRRK